MSDSQRNGLSRRQFLALVGSATGAMALAACAAPVAQPGSTNAAAPAAAKRQLVFWGHDQHPIDLAAEGFQKANPDIEWVSPHPADWGAKLVAAMAAGSGVPDLAWAEATSAQDWGCNDLLTDLTDVLTPVLDQFHPAKVAETFVAKHGRYVGWPGDISVSGWYYREDKLAEGGYGDVDLEAITWPEFLQMASELGKKGMYTFCFPADGWASLFFFTLHQVGGTAVSKDGQTMTVGDEKGALAMQLVKGLWDSGGGLDVGWWSAPYWAALKEGKLIGDFAAAWAKGFWEANLKDAEDKSAFGNWRIAKFPGGDGIKYRTGIWGGAQLVNPKVSTNRDDAITFMQYALGSVEGATACGTWGIIPSYRPYLESEAFLTQKSPVFGDWEFCRFWQAQEKELSPEFFRPAGWDAINAVVGKEMMTIMKGEMSVEDGMARIVELATPDFERTRCS